MSDNNIQTTNPKTTATNKKEAAFLKPALAWGIIGGVFALCVAIALIVILPMI